LRADGSDRDVAIEPVTRIAATAIIPSRSSRANVEVVVAITRIMDIPNDSLS
jgi:hypothetical protein